MVRFSKFFFLLFTLLTICPLLALFGWDRYQAEQYSEQAQANSLEYGVEWILSSYTKYLQDETLYFDRIEKSFSGQTLSIEQYQTLMGTEDVTEQPINRYAHRAKVDYALDVEKTHNTILPCIQFIVPLKDKPGRAIIIQKPIPYQKLTPPGPYVVSIYAGNATEPSSLIATLKDPNLSQVLKEDKLPFKRDQGKLMMNEQGSDVVLKSLNGTPILNVVLKSALLFHIQQKQEQFGFWLTVIILVSGSLSSILAGNYLNKNFIVPLASLSVATRKVQAGEYFAKVETENISYPDVITTFENFNQMIQQLAEKENLKKNFISNLTHDLRTPLIAQERALELLLRKFKSMSVEEQESFFDSLLTNNRHLLGMVNQILETYQFEEGKVKLSFQEIILSELVNSCFEQLMPLAHERTIELASLIPTDLPPFQADYRSLLRVFNNLVGNAIENIPKGKKVEISARHNEDVIEIHVRDTGLGLPEAIQKQLFERYAEGYGDTRKIGTGLGLYICKMFIQAHQGSISVDSQPGEYTDFKIILPINLNQNENPKIEEPEG
ncbi:MAG: HAMP domain-containing histidine kinase [Cyanobacteria bacterium]|nr:HAMP domain-containing histidine kinase [Cyanobacteriota bacterium]